MVYKKNDVVGTIFFYDFNPINHSIKCSCFFNRKVRNSLLVVESMFTTLLFVIDLLGLYKLRFSVYISNRRMIKLANKIHSKIINFDSKIINYELSKNSICYMKNILDRILSH